MARCPRCRAKQGYLRLLYPITRKRLSCNRCGASLRVNKVWLFPYALLVNLVAAFLGLAMVTSKEYLTTIVLLLIWILISVAVYPLVVVLSLGTEEA